MSEFSWENEWRLNGLKEESFMVKHVMNKTPKWIRFVRRRVPKTLQNTMDYAFGKAFYAVFDKGAFIIEKTYNKKAAIQIFRDNKLQMEEDKFSRKAIRRFERQSKRTVRKNLIISFFEGFGFGLFGMGLPDIPIFVSVLLKSIYEISLSYGFPYNSEQERLFILYLIETGLDSGKSLRDKDAGINEMIDSCMEREQTGKYTSENAVREESLKSQVDASANALSHQLLYWKFVQSKGIIGVVGGMSDFLYLKRITDYAMLKYKRRFLLRQQRYGEI